MLTRVSCCGPLFDQRLLAAVWRSSQTSHQYRLAYAKQKVGTVASQWQLSQATWLHCLSCVIFSMWQVNSLPNDQFVRLFNKLLVFKVFLIEQNLQNLFNNKTNEMALMVVDISSVQ